MGNTEADRPSEVKAFDGLKVGVKGLLDQGIKEIPAAFRVSPVTLTNVKPPPSITSQFKIPTIDLKGRVLDKNDRRSLVEKIGEASEKLGFFQVINHGIPLDLLEKMIDGTRKFHELEPEAKEPFYSRDHLNRNLVYYSNYDLKSAARNWRDTLTCYTAPNPPSLEELPEVLGETLLEHSKQIKNLGEFLLELLSEALGLNPNHLKEMGCSKFQMSTYLYYPHCPQPDLALGIKQHSDVCFITMLLQDNIGGLQVLHEDYWIDVPPVPGALVINIGDFLQLISNDKFISPVHRVLANGSIEPRISVPSFFTSFRKDNPTVFGPIKELLSEDNPPKYKDFTITEYIKVYSSKDISIPTLPHFKI